MPDCARKVFIYLFLTGLCVVGAPLKTAGASFDYLAKHSNILVDGTKYEIYITNYNPSSMQKGRAHYAVVAVPGGEIVDNKETIRKALFTLEVKKAITQVQLYGGWLGRLEEFGLKAHEGKMKYSTQIEWALVKVPIRLLTIPMSGGVDALAEIAGMGKDAVIEDIKAVAKQPRRQAIEKAYDFFSEAAKKIESERETERSVQNGQPLDYATAKSYVEDVEFIKMYFEPSLDLWAESFNEEPLEKKWLEEMISSLNVTPKMVKVVMTGETLRKIVEHAKSGIAEYAPYQRFLKKVENNKSAYERALAELESRVDEQSDYDPVSAKARLTGHPSEGKVTHTSEEAGENFQDDFKSYGDQELINGKPHWESSDDFYSQGWRVEGGEDKYIHFHPSPWPGGFQLGSNYAICHIQSTVEIRHLLLSMIYSVLVNSEMKAYLSGDKNHWVDITEVIGMHNTGGDPNGADGDLSPYLDQAKITKDVYVKFTGAAYSGDNWGVHIHAISIRIK